jgi:hypothetical protein
MLECDIPVMTLALAPLAEEALLGWPGAAFTVFAAVIVIWLEFFWHC